jgi:hypothetical protein
MRKLILAAMAVLGAIAILSGASAGLHATLRSADAQKSIDY